MDIEGMGEAVVRQVLGRGLVKDVADIYFLKKADLLTLEFFKDKKAENLLGAIDASKKKPLSCLLVGLGIRHVGEKAAQILAEAFDSIDRLAAATEEEYLAIPQIGQVMAQFLVDFFRRPESLNLIDKFKTAGVAMTEPKKIAVSAALEGKSFVFTGELKRLTRARAETLVRERGGRVVGTVTKTTDYVVVGQDPGSKYEKAKVLGRPIIDEASFEKLVNS
jgi:DNA ligase (NAD+)